MRQTLVRVAALAILATASAFAADLDANEKKWVQQCIDNLVAKSALIRSSAERAISGLGQDALPAVVAATGKLKTDADWLALSRAIAGMGPGARKTLDGLRMSWPKGTETRFGDMLSFLDKAEEEAKKTGTVAIPASPGNVAARVKQILDGYRNKRSMSADDPEIKELVALGHDAVGAILKFLSEDGSQSDFGPPSSEFAAKHALAQLADASDLPTLTALLQRGRTVVAPALGNFDAAQVLDVFVEAIDKTIVDSDLMEGLARLGREPRIQKALCAWLRKPAAVGKEWVVAEVAELLQESGAADAVAPLVGVLAKLADLQPRQRVALALARLGEKSAILALIDVLTMADSHAMRFDYPRHEAGLALNDITGTTIYTGHEVEVAGPHTGPLGYVADWAGAAKAFREWWAANKDKLRFDTATRTWSVK